VKNLTSPVPQVSIGEIIKNPRRDFKSFLAKDFLENLFGCGPAFVSLRSSQLSLIALRED
jgi:hypothetical protein